MQDRDLFVTIGKLESKIDMLEKSLIRLENSVSTLTEAMSDNKGSWRVLVALAGASSLFGALAHKPIDIILGMLR